MKAYGTGHKKVIVLADDGSITAVGLFLVGEVFVEAALVAFDVHAFADYLDEVGDYHGLGDAVGVEAVAFWDTFDDFVFALLAGVEVFINGAYLVEDIPGLVAVDIAVAVVGF